MSSITDTIDQLIQDSQEAARECRWFLKAIPGICAVEGSHGNFQRPLASLLGVALGDGGIEKCRPFLVLTWQATRGAHFCFILVAPHQHRLRLG